MINLLPHLLLRFFCFTSSFYCTTQSSQLLELNVLYKYGALELRAADYMNKVTQVERLF